ALPTVNAGSDITACFGPVNLAAMANGPGMWSGGSGSFANPANAMTTYTPAPAQEGTTFNLTYTVTNSCGATNDAVSVTYPANQAQFQYNPNVLCTNGSPQAPTHNTFGRNGTYTYNPMGGIGTLSINSVSGVITPATSTPGVYKITNTIPASTSGPSLIITGILDGPLTGGLPKFIELYAIQAIPNLSIFGLENASNGTPSAGVPDYVFPAVSVAAGAFIYVASETTGFTQWMGFAPNFVNAVANNNGDDAVLLFQSGSVVDVYGVPGVDGTGQSWETMDGWGHRNPGSCPSAVYIPSQWSYSGPDALDDSNVTTGTNATATPPYPTANFSPGLCGGSSSCTFVFMDTITIRPAPVVDAGPGRVTCGPMPVTLAASGVGTWNGGAGTFSNVNSPTSTYTPNASEVGSSVYLYYRATDAICGVSKDSTSITFIQPPLSGQFTYQAQEFCPNGPNPVVSHTTGVDGIYRVTQGNPNNVDLDNLTGEIELSNTQIGTYTVTNNVYACGNLIITGFVDGPLVGGQPKAIEFYAIEDIADLSIYGLGVANNGGGSDGIEDVFPNDFVPKGSFIYAAVNGVDFQAYFGFAPDYIFPDFQINGDDAIELFCSGDVIDVFGEINQSGTGLAWEYMDGWVYRKNNQNIAGNYFNVNDWIYGGVNVLDNTTTNATAPTPFPLGTFTTNATPVCPPNTFSQTILIGDNRLPQVVCPPNQTIILSPGECGVFAQFPKPEVIDNCAGDPVINQTGGPLPGVFVHKDDSPVTITFEVFDFFGNGPVACSYQVNILEYPYPTTALACNDRINLSLDADCYAFVNADMILEGGPYGCYDDYIVNISGIMGQEITQPGVYNVTVTDPDTGNSCWGVIYAEDKLPPIIRCEQPMCDLLDLQGIWDSEDNDFAPGACWAFDGFAPNPGILYDVLQFTVAVGGNYTFTMDDSPLFDGIAGIYAGSFDANDPCTNLIGGDDDINGIFETEPSFTINLTPGTYYLVSSTWVAGQMGSYSWTFSGPANLQTPCHFTCLDKEGILSGDIEIPEPEVFECSDYTLTHTTKVTGDECIGEN
ncbi:MAG TPA: hypothetical protein PK037_06675, partial [Saprospiraceae bacterium]|nr:hypothetical protein [Saprospiraceae bacterium]